MPNLTYSEQLKHPNWQRKRLEVLAAASWECANCGDTEMTLHVHHRRYVKGRMAWEYEAHEMQALCQSCHAQKHEQRELLERLLSTGDCSYDPLRLAIGLLAGFMESHSELPDELEKDCRALGREFVYGQMAGLFGERPWDKVAAAADQMDIRHITSTQLTFVDWLSTMKGV
jgi:hypothetical protein